MIYGCLFTSSTFELRLTNEHTAKWHHVTWSRSYAVIFLFSHWSIWMRMFRKCTNNLKSMVIMLWLFDFCRTILLSVGVLEAACTGHIASCRHLLLSSKATALIDLSLQLLTDALPPKEPLQGGGALVGGTCASSKSTPLCGPLLSLLASMISTLTSGPLREDSTLLSPLLDVIGWALYSIFTHGAYIVARITFNAANFCRLGFRFLEICLFFIWCLCTLWWG